MHRVVLVRWAVVLFALGLVMTPPFTLQAVAQENELGLSIHPQAITSTIIRRSGDGEVTRWIQVSFTVKSPYSQVVKFYREQAGKGAQLSEIDSGKLLNTMILFSRELTDQFNINISSQLGGKTTKVELSRNFARP
jgi:hypothetical protein